MRAHDYSAHKRIVIVEGERVRGELVVLLGKRAWVTPLDVTIWDEGRISGRVIYSDTFSASVEHGVCDLPEHMIRSDSRDDVLEVLDEMKAACIAAVEALAGVEITLTTNEGKTNG